jgi:hypothetical protein
VLSKSPNLFYTTSNYLPTLYHDINEDLHSLAEWFYANKLSINVSKTNYVLVSRQNVSTESEVKIGNTKIERKHYVKLLGIIVDQKVDWSEHIRYCKAKLSSSLYALNAAKRYLTTHHLLMLYNYLIYLYLTYGVLLWESTRGIYIYNISK